MRIVLLTLLLFTTVAAAVAEPASAHHAPCFDHSTHRYVFICEPDASDPTCITWFFWVGDARVCPLG